MLRLVVYANKRPGADFIVQNRFSIMMAQNGMELNERVWGTFIKPGLHIEQAMVVSRAGWEAEELTTSQRRATRKPYDLLAQLSHPGPGFNYNKGKIIRKPHIGPQLPPMQLEEEPEAFRRVKFYQASQPIENLEDARYRLDKEKKR
jgi:hypothetical protein